MCVTNTSCECIHYKLQLIYLKNLNSIKIIEQRFLYLLLLPFVTKCDSALNIPSHQLHTFLHFIPLLSPGVSFIAAAPNPLEPNQQLAPLACV